MKGEYGDERQIGRMRRHLEPRILRHLRHLERAREPAQIADVGLHHIDRTHVDHEPPQRQLAVLLAARDIEGECVGYLLGPRIFPIRARLLEMADAVMFELASDFDRLFRRIAAVGIDQEPGFGP